MTFSHSIMRWFESNHEGRDFKTVSGRRQQPCGDDILPPDAGWLADWSLALLGSVRDALGEGSEAGEQRVALVLLSLPELGIGGVKPVQDAQHTKTLVESATRKEFKTKMTKCVQEPEPADHCNRLPLTPLHFRGPSEIKERCVFALLENSSGSFVMLFRGI